MTKKKVNAALKRIYRNTDDFDQVIKGQCRKLTRLIEPVGVKNFSISQLVFSMQDANFTNDFITLVTDQLKGETT